MISKLNIRVVLRQRVLMAGRLVTCAACICALVMVARNVRAEPFTVGVAIPLTGDLAAYGAAVQNGFALSREDFPNSTVKMAFEDNRYDAKQSLSAYRALVDQKQVNLLFSWGETPLQSIAPLIERNEVPTIAMSLDPAPAYGKKWVVLSVNHPADMVGALRRELRRKAIRSVGFVVTDDPFVKALHEEFVATQDSGESSEILGTIAPGEMDLRTLTLKANKAKYDALGVYLLSGQVQAFYREASRIGYSPRSFGTDVFENREEIAAAGKAMQGGFYPNLAVPDDFYRRYVATYKGDDQIAFAYNAFVIGRWIHSTFGGAQAASLKAYDKEAILTAIRNGSYGAGISVKQATKGSTHISFPVVIRVVKDGGFSDIPSVSE